MAETSPTKITEKPISEEEKREILNNYEHLPANWQSISPFCVDGRKGDVPGLYPQALGGSLNIVVINALLQGDLSNFNDKVDADFASLKNAGFALGVHGDNHALCGCGFCQNLAKVIARLKNNKQVIFDLLKPHIREDRLDLWDEVMETISRSDESTLPEGTDVLEHARSIDGVKYQELTGKHLEQAAIVNTVAETTLNVDKNQNPVFNLDLWYVEEQAKALDMADIDVEKAKLLTLGLYVATEMVLVEDIKRERLPIVVR